VHSDAELFAAAMAGGPEAFAPIVKRYQDAVFGVALARLTNFHDAQDIAQQAFVEAFQQLGNLKDPSRLGAWLRSVTIHRSIDLVRRRRETAAVEDDMVSANEPTPPQRLERQELRKRLLAAIGRLSKTQRETTTLFYVNGYTVEDVARIQDVRVGTVKVRLHDAREKLKGQMLVMVEDVLKSEAPDEDFRERVLELLKQKAQQWLERFDDVWPDLHALGAGGIEGFAKAFESPHPRLRCLVVDALHVCNAEEDRQAIAALLHRAFRDPNPHVRSLAIRTTLERAPLDEAFTRREFLPLAVALLFDPAKRVRWRAAWELRSHWAHDVPLEKAVRAMLDEPNPGLRQLKERLVRAVLEASASTEDGARAPSRRSLEHVDALRADLSDKNASIRIRAAKQLLGMPVDEEQKRQQILPMVLPLLHDRAKRVRWRVAYELYPWAAYVSIDEIERACRTETYAAARDKLARLLRKATEVQGRNG
jgi:RNA polymerase sigma-70 factor (ECF subfamily)